MSTLIQPFPTTHLHSRNTQISSLHQSLLSAIASKSKRTDNTEIKTKKIQSEFIILSKTLRVLGVVSQVHLH